MQKTNGLVYYPMKTVRYHLREETLDVIALHRQVKKIWLSCTFNKKVRWGVSIAVRNGEGCGADEFCVRLHAYMFTNPVSLFAKT